MRTIWLKSTFNTLLGKRHVWALFEYYMINKIEDLRGDAKSKSLTVRYMKIKIYTRNKSSKEVLHHKKKKKKKKQWQGARTTFPNFV